MAKYRRRRYRKRRAIWSSNMQRLNIGPDGVDSNSPFYNSITISQNPPLDLTKVSTKYTVKNIEIAAQLETSGTGDGVENIEYYIIYVPEGYVIDGDLPFKHPEWIMAYKFIGSALGPNAITSNSQVPRIKSRLARKLNTGDSIIFMYMGYNKEGSTNVKLNGLLRWWTKSN